MTNFARYFYLLCFIFIGCVEWKLCTANNVDGGWSPWSKQTTACTEPCNGGELKKRRSCTNPTPEGTGEKCTLTDGTKGTLETKEFSCNEHRCASGWSNWTDCDNCTVQTVYRWAICEEPEGTGNCTDNQALEETKECNKWDVITCPDPCDEVDDIKECPEYAVCKNISTKKEPKWECSCTMGYIMSKDKKACLRPPPTPPTARPIPVLPEAQKKIATGMSKSASAVLVIFVGISFVLFLILRIFTPDRVIQMNMEIAIFLAHCFLFFPSSTAEDSPLLCSIVSMLIHFFFTACFAFMMLEALHMYSLVAFVVKRDGLLTKFQNIFVGWGIALIVVIFCICFEYKNYGAEYHCWLQMDTYLMLGELIPIFTLVIITVTLIEAAGAANYKPLNDMDLNQLLSAKISQRSNLIILLFVVAHMITGMYSEYDQDLALYGIFSILNAVTGFLIFFFHCTGNETVRAKLASCYRSIKN